ncbi:MAG: EipA family protein [Pseudomonadota bacterium]
MKHSHKVKTRKTYFISIYFISLLTLALLVIPSSSVAQDLPWGESKEPTLITPKPQDQEQQNPVPQSQNKPEQTYRSQSPETPDQGIYQNPQSPYRSPDYNDPGYNNEEAYAPPPSEYRAPRNFEHNDAPPRREPPRDYAAPPPDYKDEVYEDDTYSDSEILRAGHSLFGSVTKGLARVIERVFSDSGRPNGYIIGEEAGGAFIAGLRYGEGTLHTKRFDVRKVYWQGPSIGYDFGAEGSKTMILVYHLDHPRQIYQTFSGVNGSAYFIGGVGLTYQSKDDVVLARIQSGVGVRLGANLGYLKYTRRPTWNPF